MSCKNTECGIFDSLLYKMKPSKGGRSNQRKITDIDFTILIRGISK